VINTESVLLIKIQFFVASNYRKEDKAYLGSIAEIVSCVFIYMSSEIDYYYRWIVCTSC